MIIESDCKSEEGITMGLIDSLIFISRILSNRDLNSINIKQALLDLKEDSDVNFIFKDNKLADKYE